MDDLVEVRGGVLSMSDMGVYYTDMDVYYTVPRVQQEKVQPHRF